MSTHSVSSNSSTSTRVGRSSEAKGALRLEQEHDQRIEAVRAQTTLEVTARLELEHAEHIKSIQASHAHTHENYKKSQQKKIHEQKKRHDAAVEELRASLTVAHAGRETELVRAHEMAIQQLRAEHAELVSRLKHEHEVEVETHEHEHKVANDTIHALRAKAESDLVEAEEEYRRRIVELSRQHQITVEELVAGAALAKEEYAHELADRVVSLNVERRHALDALRESLQGEHETALLDVKAQMSAELSLVKEQHVSFVTHLEEAHELALRRTEAQTAAKVEASLRHERDLAVSQLESELSAARAEKEHVTAALTVEKGEALASLTTTYAAEVETLRAQLAIVQEERHGAHDQIRLADEELIAAESRYALALSELRETHARELESSQKSHETVSEQLKQVNEALVEDERKRQEQASQILLVRLERDNTKARIDALETQLKEAGEVHDRLHAMLEEARAEAARPQIVVVSKTPPREMSPLRDAASLETPGLTPSSDEGSGADPFEVRTPGVEECNCRLDTFEDKLHIPHILRLPKSMHRCQVHSSKPARSPSPSASEHSEKAPSSQHRRMFSFNRRSNTSLHLSTAASQ